MHRSEAEKSCYPLKKWVKSEGKISDNNPGPVMVTGHQYEKFEKESFQSEEEESFYLSLKNNSTYLEKR